MLSLRELNRATLARQLLLRRERIPVVRAIERVAGLQAQWAPTLPVGLWTRLEGFQPAQLERALARKQLVRATLMRSTIHLVSTRDYVQFHPALAQAIRRRYRRAGDETALLEELAARVAAAVREPLPAADVRALVDPERWFRVLHHARLLRVGEDYVAADAWLDLADASPEQGLRHLLRRYLAAWGPATAADAAAWSGLQVGELREAIEEVGTRRCADERGRELYDLPRAPLPPADTPAPPRLLPRFDNVVLAHADRTRVVSDEHRKVIIRAGEVDPVVLVDGFVAGRWRRKGKRIDVEWLATVPRTAREAIDDEASRLAGSG
ncbi:MAG: winged helix DNA-binding domain-containing protein [Gaiellaceae bacterium]